MKFKKGDRVDCADVGSGTVHRTDRRTELVFVKFDGSGDPGFSTACRPKTLTLLERAKP